MTAGVLLAVLLMIFSILGVSVLLKRHTVVALFLLAFTFIPYISFGALSVRLGYLVIALTCFFLLLLLILSGSKSITIAYSSFNLALVAFTVWIYITTITNRNVATFDSLTFIVVWSSIVVFFLLSEVNFHSANADKVRFAAELILGAIIFCGVMACLFAVLEQIFPDAVHMLYSPSVVEENIWGSRNVEWAGIQFQRGGSVIGSPNAFGAFLLIPLMAMIIKTNTKNFVWTLPLILVMLFTLVVLSNSRGALLGFLISTMIYLWMNGYRLLLSVLFAVVVATTVIGMSADWLQVPYVPQEAVSELGDVGILPEFLLERAYFWSFVLLSISGDFLHFLIGYGVANQVMADAIEKRGAHSLIFSTLHFYGIIGFVLAMNLIFKFGKVIQKSSRHLGWEWVSGTAFYSGIALLAHSLVDDIVLANTAVMGVYFTLLLPIFAAFTMSQKNGYKVN